MGNKYKKLSSNTLLFALNSFGAKAISFFLLPLYTAVLSCKDYGSVDLITSAALLLIPVMTLNIQDAVLRFALEKGRNKGDIISVGLRQILIGAAILALALFILTYFQVLELESKYIGFLFAYFLLHGLYNSFSMYLRATDKVRVFVVSSLTNTFVACTLNIMLLAFVGMGINGYLIANISGILLATSMMLFMGGILKDFHWKTPKGLTKEMLLYSTPLVLNSVAWWINDISARYVLTLFCGLAINGIFAVAYKIPTILSTLQTIFYNSWSISAIKDFDKDDSDGFLGNIYTLFSCVSAVGCSFVMIMNIPLASVLYTNQYFKAWEFVPFLLLGAVFNGLALFEGALFAAAKKTKLILYTTLFGASINLCANIIFILFIGPLGAAIATMLGYFATWCVRTYQVQRLVKLKVNWHREFLAILLLSGQASLAFHRGYEWAQGGISFILIVLYFNYIQKITSTIVNKLKSRRINRIQLHP